jgi:hypothetical protein
LVAFELGPIINDPCPVGLVISRKKAINKENGQFMEAILSYRSFIRPRGLNGSSNGTVEVLTVERLRPRRQAQREECEDRN